VKDWLKNLHTLSSVVLENVVFTSAFVVKLSCNLSANKFAFPCSVVARFSFSFQRDISGFICQMLGYSPHVLHVIRGWVLKSLMPVVTELSFCGSVYLFF
jgi:hypothetical protein